jgi:hypothetical protein
MPFASFHPGKVLLLFLPKRAVLLCFMLVPQSHHLGFETASFRPGNVSLLRYTECCFSQRAVFLLLLSPNHII